ncbi:Methyltransferase type 11 [Methanothrix thermoacetophila PT]|uniref:Methyltransferase type 11 n=1 Tax=Methanothrix thermoacetophila (strain DSM 6194 / JCM 14653 / NBRC 101360 / PT) TaxID=349307 RepID=A0B834_METTP|nr:Methyltransferase type 11 [Methanothrix thermoacetophila PT]
MEREPAEILDNDGFYLEFENRFRGSQELVRSRLYVYLPFVLPLKSIYGELRAVDLGCGRGEWLELLKENGFQAEGVDLDDAMVNTCRSKGLSVEKADAIEHLERLDDESAVIVSGFHIIEHIPFESVKKLVKDAYRVLKPGGLLILETPNPESLIVSTTEFYLDPTHKRPIPPNLLHFLVECSGFARIKILRLNEPSQIQNPDEMSLADVFFGVSPDYAVVAQKGTSKEQMSLFDRAFDKKHGLARDELVMRYAEKEKQLIAYERERWRWLESEWRVMNSKIDRLADEMYQTLESERARAQMLERELRSVYSSKCWQITAPLRVGFDLLLGLKATIIDMPTKLRRKVVYVIMMVLGGFANFVLSHSILRRMAAYMLKRSRRLDAFSKSVLSSGLVERSVGSGDHSCLHLPPDISELSHHARHIYRDLKEATERSRR